MNESTDVFAAASEVTGRAMEAFFNYVPGGSYSFLIRCDRAVVRDLGVIAVSLYSIYKLTPVLERTIEGVVNRCLEHPRSDQDPPETSPGSLHVKLRCLTDERFLEVWTDYKSGKMKERLQEEFSKSGIEVKGLKIEIENLEKVNETKKAIESRSELPSEHTLEMKDEGDIKHESEDEMKDFGDIRASQDEIEVELYRVKARQMKIERNPDVTRQQLDEIMRQPDQMERPTMPCRMEDEEQGYDLNRFVGEVREDLLCSVCKDVPMDPRVCQNEDHIFCLAHISRHLHQNSHTCPVCRDPLTPETLKRPTRILKNYLKDLKIKCDHHDRGCPDVVRLEDLQRHVDQCGFAPVICGNEGCETEVNRRDQRIHERDLCQFRIAKCHDCTDIKASQNEMKASQDEMKASQDEIKEFQSEVKIEMEEIERKQDEMKENVDEMKQSQNVINDKVNQVKENVDEMKQSQNVINDKVNQMKENVDVMKQSQDVINVKVNKMKDNVDEMKQTQAEMKADQMAFEAEVKKQFERMTVMLNQLLQGRNVNNNAAQALDVPVNNQDIIILGGWYAPGRKSVSNTVEKFNRVEGKSTQLPELNHPRAVSASSVYDSDVIITGGFDGQAGTDSIEILKINQDPLRWMMFDGKLPYKLSSHDVIVYQGKLYVTGGYNWSEKKTTDNIYELSMIPPYTAKLLARMPQPRRHHRAEIVNGKLFTLGGKTTGLSKDTVDSVVVYDFINNEVKPCPPLPKPVRGMSTVTWGNTVILIGGRDKNDQVLNEVTMYDTESGQSQKLPSLIHKRTGSSAVIMHDVIVVLGGWNQEEGHLNSAESFTMGDDHWRELPGMKEKRANATAVVKPRN